MKKKDWVVIAENRIQISGYYIIDLNATKFGILAKIFTQSNKFINVYFSLLLKSFTILRARDTG